MSRQGLPTLGIEKGMTILCMASQRARSEMVTHLLRLGAKPFVGDSTGRLPIHYAALGNDRADNIRALLGYPHGIDNVSRMTEKRDHSEMAFTPLMR